MKLKVSLLLALFYICCGSTVFAQRGKDGAKTISTANTVVNEYTVLSADANVGATTIQVANNGLNANNRFSTSLTAGDLIMIIQAQGATISGTFFTDGNGDSFGLPKDSSWGGIQNYNNCGNYELLQVAGVQGTNTITLNCALTNNYTASGKVQVVRMPRYTTLTINNSSSIIAENWSGSKGGVVAVEVDGATVNNGSISATGQGFRGGAVDNQSNFGSNDVASTNSSFGGEKGEGIAGYQNDYNSVGGRYCKGAPANGGGGGNMHNAGGGGGGNGGDPTLWRAVGNPSLIPANFANAWNLEWAGLATTTSTGGGKGGYSASANNQNALTLGPNQGAWGGDNRNKQGGYGGRPLDYASNRIFFGGGGGAGDGDDGYAGAGGNAGGIVFLDCYGPITGSGTLLSNGNAGANAAGNASATSIAGKDGAGGGGAGGTIFIRTTSTIVGNTMNANGGLGGDQFLTKGFFAPAIVEAQGPGGGGGGGYINTTVPVFANVTGAANGVTNSPSLSEFVPNGATVGGAGTIINNLPSFDILANDESICAGNTVTLTASTIGNIPTGAVLTWFDAPSGGVTLGTGTTFTTPILNATTTYYIGVCPSSFTKAVTVTVGGSGSTSIAGANQQVCQNSAQLAANTPASGTGAWSVISGSAIITDSSDPASTVTNLSAGNNVFEWTISISGCPPSQSQVTIEFSAAPTPDAGVDQQLCNTTATLAAVLASGTGTWSVFSGTAVFTDANDPLTQVSNLSAGTNVLIWEVTIPGCNASQDTVEITVANALSIADAGINQQVCGNTATLSAVSPSVGLGTWTVVSGSGAITDVNNASSTVTGIGVGTTVFEWTVSGAGCPSTQDQVSITTTVAPASANAGTDFSECGANTSLTANAPDANCIGTWTSLQTSTISNANLNNTAVTNLQLGSNSFIWTITNSLGCSTTSDTIIVTSVSVPDAATAGADKTICDVNITLSGNTPTTGIGTWTITQGAGNIANNQLSNTTVSGLLPGQITLVWTIANAPCPSSSDTVKITILTPLSAANAGSDASICATNYTMSATAPTNGNGTWTTIAGNGTLSSTTNPLATLSNLQVGVNTFQWTVSNGVCPDVSDQVSITVAQPPSTANAGSDQVTCTQATQISAVQPSIGTGNWIVSQGNAVIDNASSPSTPVLVLSAGGATFTWVVSSGTCPTTSDDLVVQLLNGSNDANAGDDVLISLGDSAQLNGTGGTINGWDPPIGLSCIACLSPMASPDTTTLYYISVTDNNGCVSIDSVLVTVDKTNGWYLPNAFTPDGNAVNDVLFFYGTGVKEFILQVYDRWGEKVFETTDTKVGWDGTFKNKPAASGIYAYQLTIIFKTTKVEQVKGNINLIRN